MDIHEIMAVYAQYPAVTLDFPFGPAPACYRLGGRIFAEVYPVGVRGALRILLQDDRISREAMIPMITLRCEPAYGDFFRQQYPGVVLRPYHYPPRQQSYGNTVFVDGRVNEPAIRAMIGHAYSYVLGKLPKRTQADILNCSKEYHPQESPGGNSRLWGF